MYDCAQGAITFNNLNLPTYDIHSKQARQQILFNFHTLSQSFVNISTKHLQKSKQQNQRIQKLRERILRCKDRIQQFQSTNQALIFVSPGQYPKKYKFDPQNNVSIFKDYLQKTQLNRLDMSAQYQVKHQIQKLGQQSKLKLNQLNQFVVFLLGQLQGKKRTAFQRALHPSKRKPQTLGHLPHGIQYIDSLTVFNSHINPYRKYQITNNVIQSTNNEKNKNKQLQGLNKDQIALDHQLKDYTKPQFQADSNRFIPQQKDLQMPDFDMDLDLDGIVNYDFNSQATFMNQFADFQNVKKKNIAADPYANSGSNKKQDLNASTISQSTNYSTNLPPPPTLGGKSQSTPNNILPPPPSLSNILPPPPSLTSILPPPPTLGLPSPPSLPPPPGGLPPPPSLGGLKLPPPPTLGLPSPPTLGGKPPSLPPSMPKVGGNDRSALLAQIQNPNPMARLRKTVTIQKGGINPPAKPKKQKKVNNTGQQSNQQQGGQNTQNSQGQQLAPIPQQKPAREMSFMQALQAKIKSRFQALHPEQDSQDDD